MKQTKDTFNSERLDYACELMRALAHPLRLRIIEFIDNQGSINVNKIYKSLNLEQSITSQHLKVLRLTGLVEYERSGKFITYSLNYSLLEKAGKAVKKFMVTEKNLVSRGLSS